MTTSTLAPPTWTPMSAAQRVRFERDGYLVVPGVLTPAEVTYYREAIDAAYRRAAAAGALTANGELHQLGAVASCPQMAGLIDHPAAFPLVWSILGWNVHVYHSHLDVHPPLLDRKPFWWHWHQDGGRQNRELETSPRPRMSVKLAYWLSDVSTPGRGNLTVIPGSHLRDRLPGPPSRNVAWPAPEDAVEIVAHPGDAVFFDRRLWHARSDNYSPIVRKVVFFGYTYRWVAIRDDVSNLPHHESWPALSPVQRQLLGGAGDGSGDHQWGHDPRSTPLYRELLDRGLLDSAYPPLIP